MDKIQPTLLDLVNDAAWEYRGEARCKGCVHWRYEGKHDEDCYWGNMIKYVESLEKVDKVLPKVENTPPMPRCKPPLDDVSETTEEIRITTVKQIWAQLAYDGDLRKHDFYEPYVCCKGDDLGFYQQASEFLVKEVDRIRICIEGHEFISNGPGGRCPYCAIDNIKKQIKLLF